MSLVGRRTLSEDLDDLRDATVDLVGRLRAEIRESLRRRPRGARPLKVPGADAEIAGHEKQARASASSINQVFSIYSAQAGVLLPVAFCLFLVVGIVDGLLSTSFVLFPLSIAVSVIAATLYQGMVVSLVRDVQDGRRDSTAGDLVNQATPVIGPLIGAGLISGIGIGIGLILLIVPGLILLTIWAVIAPVIVVERSGVIDAFSRSRELVRGNGWEVFGVVVSPS